MASSSGCVLFYLPWAWGTAAILRGRRQAPAASPQVARASGRCSTTPVWASTLPSLGFIVQACIVVILCTGPGDASWWIDLLNGGLYAQGIRLPAEDRPHCQGSLDRRSVDARLPLRPGGNIGVQAPDALKRGVDKNLLTGDDGCIFIDVRLGFLSTVRRCVSTPPRPPSPVGAQPYQLPCRCLTARVPRWPVRAAAAWRRAPQSFLRRAARGRSRDPPGRAWASD